MRRDPQRDPLHTFLDWAAVLVLVGVTLAVYYVAADAVTGRLMAGW